MIEEMKPEAMGILLGLIVAFNMVLSGLSIVLNFIKNKTATKLDNKASLIVNKIAKVTQKSVDFIGMNRPH